MKMHSFISIIFIALVLSSILAASVSAQDSSRRPGLAFPIGAGEKMIVIPGIGLNSAITYSGTSALSQGDDFTFWYHINLPVGTRLIRLLGDFVDQVDANLVISIVRYQNTSPATFVTVRSIDTSNINSVSPTDFKQVVSNPANHVMLQGWTYMIHVDFPGGTNSGDLVVGEVKLIYEP